MVAGARADTDIAASLSLGFTEIASSSSPMSAKAAANVKRFRVAEFEILWPILRRLPSRSSETASDSRESSFPVLNGYSAPMQFEIIRTHWKSRVQLSRVSA